MIRQDLDIVPVVQPKHRLEEDNRRAAERRRVAAAGSSVEAQQPLHIARYTLLCDHKEGADECDATGSGAEIRLFSLSSHTELSGRTIETLKVLDAPKKTWKRHLRTTYQAVLSSLQPSVENGDNMSGDDDEEEEEGEGEGEGLLRFSSLPIVEYENMDCLLVTLPPIAAEEEAVGSVKVLNAPLHALRHERVEVSNSGQGISSSWHSGIDVRSVRFKRSYIDDDDTDPTEDKWRDDFDGSGAGKRNEKKSSETKTEVRSAAKKSKVEKVNSAGEAGALKTLNTTESSAMRDTLGGASKDNVPTPSLAAPAAEKDLNDGNSSPVLSGVDREDLSALTANLLQQWVVAGKETVLFSDVVKTVLKVHPLYAEMRTKHQSTQGRQEAVEWFRVSQSAVRTCVLHLGYTIDSANNVYLHHRKVA
uniref:Uncharacterized protein n=1 Tax=Trypanosoma vivax (strain Y486) TaxID=1055687 RepID=G0U973_TRYVY|nr:conserved hypothetical protein [Trypanosoma vivax Y486]